MQVIIVLLKYCGLLVKPGDEKSWITQKSYYISKSLKILVLNFLDFNNVRWNPLEAVAAFLKWYVINSTIRSCVTIHLHFLLKYKKFHNRAVHILANLLKAGFGEL